MLEFARPEWLLLLLAIPGIVWLALRLSYASLGPFQKWLSLGLRLVVWVLLVCALAGVQFVKQSDRVSVMLAFDESDSIDKVQIPALMDQLEEARKTMKKDDTLGKLTFGADPSLEYLPVAGVDDEMLLEHRTDVRGNFTNIGEALQLAIASFPDNAQKRLVLITDGNENIGSAVSEARIARDNNVELYVVPVGTKSDAEVILSNLEAPNQASLGETINLRFVLESNVATPATISLHRNGVFADKVEMNIRPGKEVYEIPVQVDEGGFFTYELQVEPELDKITENNRAYAYTVVEGQPRLLYATGDPNELNYLPSTLQLHNLEMDVVGPSGIPYSLSDFMAYDGIIFSDISAIDITEDQMLMVQTLVRDFGKGFLMIGGENSFGPGGYYDTPIEETLPVDMDFRRKKITPSSMVLCLIDKSGSMGATVGGHSKIAMAKEALKEVVDLQTDRDYVGVMGFDALGQWVIQPTQGADREELKAKISSMQAGGGTDLYPALKAAYESSKDVPTQIKHVIIFTDGIVAPADFNTLVKKMVRDGYTVSTVAFGTDADIPFMRQLAEMGEGQMYEAQSLYDLPKIFTREVFMANKATITEDPFAAIPTMDHPLVSSIGWGGSPVLYGYVATSAKDTAQVPLVTHKDDPLLAVWHYGLGKSAAFTSDAKNRWARQWLDWGGYERFWTGVARWIRSEVDTSGMNIQTSISGSYGVVQVSAVSQDGEFVNYGNLEARVTDPEMESQTFKLEQVGPGEYEARFPLTENGNYFVSAIQYADDGEGNQVPAGAQAAGLSVSYSPEYKNLEPDEFLINHLQTSSLALEGVTLAGLFAEQRRPQRRLEDAWELFTLIALLLWLVDVAARRLVLDWKEWQAAAAGVFGGAGFSRARQTSESLAGLLAVKTRVQHRPTGKQVEAQRTERRETLAREAAARSEAKGGEEIQIPTATPRAPSGQISSPQQKPETSSLSGLRQRMDKRDTTAKRPEPSFSLRDIPSSTPKPAQKQQPQPQKDVGAREMTSRLLDRKRKGDDRRDN